MKSLKEYLIESKKTYPFKIGVAGDIPDGFNERLRTALEKYSVASLSAGKKTPIQKRPHDFPQLENTEVTYWDVEITYPTTEAILREYLSNVCTLDEANIIVRNPNAKIPEHNNDPDEGSDTYEVMLTKEDMGGVSAQADVGNNRVMELLKELESARKERGENNDGFKAEATKEEPLNTRSAMGS
jgi:hypothetical protein